MERGGGGGATKGMLDEELTLAPTTSQCYVTLQMFEINKKGGGFSKV